MCSLGQSSKILIQSYCLKNIKMATNLHSSYMLIWAHIHITWAYELKSPVAASKAHLSFCKR